MQAGEVDVRGLVESGGNASPGFQLVGQALDGVPFLVEAGVVTDRPTATEALPLPVGGLVLLLRDDCLDAASAQMPCPRRPLRAGCGGGRRDPRARIFPSTGMNCGLSVACPAVSTNASGRHPRSAARQTLPVCPPRECPREPVFSRSPHRRRIRRRSCRSRSAFRCHARLDLLLFSSAAAFSSAVMTSWSRCVPAASW